MPTEEYRQYLEEKFSNVNDKLDTIHDTTQKTNGRVNEHDVRINELEKSDATKYFHCPERKRIDRINEDLMEYKVIKKYPKISIMVIVLFGITALAVILGQFGII